MAQAQPKTKLRVWLFKSFVTAGNDILAKQVEAWAQERKVDVEMDWATFGDREQKFVAAIEAGNPPDLAEMNYLGPARYKPALRDVSPLAKDYLVPPSILFIPLYAQIKNMGMANSLAGCVRARATPAQSWGRPRRGPSRPPPTMLRAPAPSSRAASAAARSSPAPRGSRSSAATGR